MHFQKRAFNLSIDQSKPGFIPKFDSSWSVISEGDLGTDSLQFKRKTKSKNKGISQALVRILF